MISSLNLSEINKICRGKLNRVYQDFEIDHIFIDSRQVFQPSKSLFVALKGAKANGVDFIPELIEKGVKSFVIPDSFDPEGLDASFIQVPNPHKALQTISTLLRSHFEKPVVGITGSNGKTIVKEWLGQLLQQGYSVVKSPKSYNSQVGVPLSILEIQAYHQVAVLEAGISKVGEMQALGEMIRPDLGIFTNIGTAHDSGFPDRRSKIHEKLQLFKDSKLLIYCSDQEIVREEIERNFPEDRLIAWSDKEGADFTRIIKKRGNRNPTYFHQKRSVHAYFSDTAS